MKNDGFTLIEVLVAVAILAAVSVTLLSITSSGLDKAAHAKEQNEITLLAQKKMGELMLEAVPTEEEEGIWEQYTTETGEPIPWEWRKNVLRRPFLDPETGEETTDYDAWEIILEVRPVPESFSAEEPEPYRVVTWRREAPQQ